SVEALAAEEAGLLKSESADDRRGYIPIIGKTATLMGCRYDPRKNSLPTGMVSHAAYSEAPKGLFWRGLGGGKGRATLGVGEVPYAAFRRLSREQERTVVVVNSKSFTSILITWGKGVFRGSFSPLPWQ